MKNGGDRLRIRRKRSSRVVIFLIATSVLDSWFQWLITFSAPLSTRRKKRGMIQNNAHITELGSTRTNRKPESNASQHRLKKKVGVGGPAYQE